MISNPPLNPCEASIASELETLDIISLVDHRESVQGREIVSTVYQGFAKHNREYVAVIDGDKFLGLCSRGQIGYLLGSRFGFSVYGNRPIRDHLMEHQLRICRGKPLLALLETTLTRTGDQFYDDVALEDADGQFLGIIGVQTLVRLQSSLLFEKMFLALSQRVELEKRNQELFRSVNELRQSQGRYAILFENAAVGVALLNPRGGIETMNRQLQTLIDLAEDSAPPDLAGLIAPEEREEFTGLLQRYEREGGSLGPLNTEFHLALPKYGKRLFKFSTSWIRETGQICVCLDDITEQRFLQQRMAQKEKTALLDSLVGGIAHEINNKLAPILGLAQMMVRHIQKGPDPSKLQEMAQVIGESAAEAAKIIQQLLQLSRPSTSKLVSCDLRTVIQDALKLAKFRFSEAGIEPSIECPEKKVCVVADPPQLKQVIVNMALNAVDAMEQSALRELRLRVTTDADKAVLSISDTGHGISPENLRRIFDPFFTTKAPDRGTGLGLSVCFSIIKQHGGEIGVESTPGTGTTFTFTLPLSNDTSANQAEPVENPPSAANNSGYRILVVDDEPFVVGLVQEMLRSELGCSVEWAVNGTRAVELIKEARFDLVISDIRMSGMTGLQLFEWIATFVPHMASRFIFITGDAGSAEMNKKLAGLPAPVLRKPFTMDSLVRQCDSMLCS